MLEVGRRTRPRSTAAAVTQARSATQYPDVPAPARCSPFHDACRPGLIAEKRPFRRPKNPEPTRWAPDHPRFAGIRTIPEVPGTVMAASGGTARFPQDPRGFWPAGPASIEGMRRQMAWARHPTKPSRLSACSTEAGSAQLPVPAPLSTWRVLCPCRRLDGTGRSRPTPTSSGAMVQTLLHNVNRLHPRVELM